MRTKPGLISMGLGIALGLLLVQEGLAAPMLIDAFGTSQSLTISGGIGPATAQGGLLASDAIGGARYATLNRLSGFGTETLLVNGGSMGFLDASSAAADTITAALVYDGGIDNVLSHTGLGGIDLTSGNANGELQISARSDLVAPIVFTIYSSAVAASTANVNLPGLGFGAVPFTTVSVPVSAFTPSLGAGADFQSVGAITVTLDGLNSPALDAQLDSIVSMPIVQIPEPGSAALFGVGVAALAALRCRRG